MISEAHVTRSDRCRVCGGKLRLTGDKMNPVWKSQPTHSRKYDAFPVTGALTGGWDELVVCENCGWTWWVHHA